MHTKPLDKEKIVLKKVHLFIAIILFGSQLTGGCMYGFSTETFLSPLKFEIDINSSFDQIIDEVIPFTLFLYPYFSLWLYFRARKSDAAKDDEIARFSDL